MTTLSAPHPGTPIPEQQSHIPALDSDLRQTLIENGFRNTKTVATTRPRLNRVEELYTRYHNNHHQRRLSTHSPLHSPVEVFHSTEDYFNRRGSARSAVAQQKASSRRRSVQRVLSGGGMSGIYETIQSPYEDKNEGGGDAEGIQPLLPITTSNQKANSSPRVHFLPQQVDGLGVGLGDEDAALGLGLDGQVGEGKKRRGSEDEMAVRGRSRHRTATASRVRSQRPKLVSMRQYHMRGPTSVGDEMEV